MDSANQQPNQTSSPHLPSRNFRWNNVPLLNYKEEDGTFRSISRQTLFDGATDLACQLRYFEIAPGGHSTLERHEHTHLVMIIRGRGRALVGNRLFDAGAFDVFSIASQTWHQFQTLGDEPLGFICIVAAERDRPHLPANDELDQIRQNPAIAAFIRSKHE